MNRVQKGVERELHAGLLRIDFQGDALSLLGARGRGHERKREQDEQREPQAEAKGAARHQAFAMLHPRRNASSAVSGEDARPATCAFSRRAKSCGSAAIARRARWRSQTLRSIHRISRDMR